MTRLGLLLLPLHGHRRVLYSILSGCSNKSLVPIDTPGEKEAVCDKRVLHKNTTRDSHQSLNSDCSIWSKMH